MSIAERNAEIVRRREAGEYPWQIAEAMSLSRNAVLGVCFRAGVTRDDNATARFAKHGVHFGAPRKLTAAAVRDIRERYWTTPRRELEAEFGVSRVTLWHVANRFTWKHVA